MISFYIKGMLVQISFWFVSIITLALLLDNTYTVVLGILSAFIHEVSHILAFALFKKIPKKLSFEITGILIEKDNVSMSLKQEIIILLAGSIVNLFIFFLLFYFNFNNQYLNIFAISNLVLGIMNLLPLNAFDGGKIMNLILSIFVNVNLAYKICKLIQFVITCIFLILYVFLSINYDFNFSLLIIIIYMFYTNFN